MGSLSTRRNSPGLARFLVHSAPDEACEYRAASSSADDLRPSSRSGAPARGAASSGGRNRAFERTCVAWPSILAAYSLLLNLKFRRRAAEAQRRPRRASIARQRRRPENNSQKHESTLISRLMFSAAVLQATGWLRQPGQSKRYWAVRNCSRRDPRP